MPGNEILVEEQNQTEIISFCYKFVFHILLICVYLFHTRISVQAYSYFYNKRSRMHFRLIYFEKLTIESSVYIFLYGFFFFLRNGKFSHNAQSPNVNSILDEATGSK